jgi:hypothetical protein
MTNNKIEKINEEIAKTKTKISEYQAKLRAQEKQKTDIENEQIIALVRSERISDAELNALMQSIRKEPAKTQTREVSEQEETDNANDEQ